MDDGARERIGFDSYAPAHALHQLLTKRQTQAQACGRPLRIEGFKYMGQSLTANGKAVIEHADAPP